jgi:hypothetical protein
LDLGKLSDGIRVNWPFLVKGPATIYEPTAAIAVGELLEPHRTPRQLAGKQTTEWPMSADQAVGPAVLVNKPGKGCVITLAAAADVATASEHHIVEARRLFRNAVRLVHPDPVVKIRAPANVESVVTEDPAERRLRVHLIGYNPTPQTTPAKNRPYILPGLIEDPPIYRASITVDREIRNASAAGQPLALQRDGSEIDLIVDDVHEVVVIEY